MQDSSLQTEAPPGADGGAVVAERGTQRAAQTVSLVADRTLPRNPVTGEPMVKESVWALHVRFALYRDPHDQTALMEQYQSQAGAIARRYYRGEEPLEDLSQVAIEGLLVALSRFDPWRRLPFAAFATPTIKGFVKRHYRDRGWSVRVPRAVHEVTPRLRDTAERLEGQLGRSPTNEELATSSGVGIATVRSVQAATLARNPSSLSGPAGEEGQIGDRVGSIDIEFDRREFRVALSQALTDFSESEQQLVRLYFIDELTQAEVGDRLGVSQMQVSRLLQRVVARLRDRIPA